MAFDAFALILTMLALGMLFARLKVLPANAAEVLNLVVLTAALATSPSHFLPRRAVWATVGS